MKHIYLSTFRLCLIGTLLFLATAAMAQKRVTGTVIGDDGLGLPGATVVAKGTTVGTVTDVDGNFSLEVPSGGNTVVVSSVGYTTQELDVSTGNTFRVEMKPSALTLQEAVVTGYGTQLKREITGAVASVTSKDLLSLPSTNAAQALQGRVAGVNVSNENAPGGNVMVRIRGFGTINDNSPLYIIDGTPTKGNLNTVNVNDIESIQILKDASEASQYGARAGNGVVIITTKQGKSGKPKFTYDVYYGQQSPIKFLDLLNTQEYVNQYWQSRINSENAGLLVDGKFPEGAAIKYPNIPMFLGGKPQDNTIKTPTIPDYIFPVGVVGTTDESLYSVSPKNLITKANKEGTDWFDVIFGNAPIQNHQIGVSGATDQARYSLSLNYFDQQGIMLYTSYKRYSIRSNTEFKVNKRVRIGQNLQVAYGRQIGQPSGNQNESNPISFAYRIAPIVPEYDIRGYFAGTPTVLDNSRNPLAELARNKDNKAIELRLLGNAYAEVDILNGLTARSQINIDYNTYNLNQYRANDIESPEPVGANRLTTFNNYDRTWTWFNTLTYKKSIGDNHRINVIVGTEAISNYFEAFQAERTGFAVDDLPNRYLRAGRAGVANDGIAAEWRLASEFARANYAFANKYLLSATMRRDRSSRFAKDFRAAYFPSVSAGWVLTEESFLSGKSWLPFFKARVGWGRTGNQEIGNYNAFSTFLSSPESSFYDLGGSKTSSQQGYELSQFGNGSAKWETTTSLNAGFDANLLNGKVDLTFDWFTRTTTDMLFPVEVQFTQGVATNPFQNIGEMLNTGIELGLTYRDRKGDFNYAVGGNFSTYQNEVVKTTGDPKTQYFGFSNLRLPTGTVSVTQQGYPVASFFGYTVDGIFQNDAEGAAHAVQFGGGQMNKAGAFKFRDINADGIINAGDRAIIGSPHPDFIYGINLSLGYKNFSLDIFGQGVYGNKLFNYVRYWTDFPTFGGNRSQRFYEQSWEPGKTDALLPIWRSNDVVSSQPSTYYLEDGSYFRLKNVQLSYTLPVNIAKRLGLGSARFYLQGQNLATFTKYEGLDPEINLRAYGAGNDRQLGVDEGVYPAFRSYNVGANITF